MSINLHISPRPPGLLLRLGGWDVEGWGEAAEASPDASRDLLADLPVEAEDFLEMLDSRDPPAMLRCAIATAWLSARAAATELSLSGLLAGGQRPAQEVPLCGVIAALPPEEAAARAASLVGQGHTALLVRCGPDRAADQARIAAVRGAAPGVKLRLDAGGQWDPASALEHLRTLWRHDIEHVVQPIPPSRPIAEVAAFRRVSPVPVALPALLQDRGGLGHVIAMRAADAVLLDPVALGGPDRATMAFGMAREAGLPVFVSQAQHGPVGTAMAVHLAATLPGPPPCPIEFGPEALAALSPAGGRVRVPTGPGLGLRP